MTIKLTWYGHSACALDVGSSRILVDPYLTGNSLAPISADAVEADYILITHGHGDHIGDAVAIAKRTGALTISNFEICNWLQTQGVTHTHPQHIGGGFQHPFGYLKLTIAHHGSSLPDGSWGGNPCGMLLTAESQKNLSGRRHRAFLQYASHRRRANRPSCPAHRRQLHDGTSRRATGGEADRAASRHSIHYDTFDVIAAQDPHAWAERVRAESSVEPIALKPGQSYEL